MGDWKSLCDERESMWQIGRGRVMIEILCGRLDLMKAMWAIGSHERYVGDWKRLCDERESYVSNWISWKLCGRLE